MLPDEQFTSCEVDGEIVNTTLTTVVSMTNPRPEDIRLVDIAHNLSNLVRFNGGMNGRYTVAEHSFLVVDLVRQASQQTGEVLPRETYAYALLHDAHEAYIGDITTPTKKALQAMSGGTDIVNDLADRFDRAIFEAAGLDPTMPRSTYRLIRTADTEAAIIEHGLWRDGLAGDIEKPLSFQQAFERYIRDARYYNIRNF